MDCPKHYAKNIVCGFEPRYFLEQYPFNLGCVFKYLIRAGDKEGNSKAKDLKKARDYALFQIELSTKREEIIIAPLTKNRLSQMQLDEMHRAYIQRGKHLFSVFRFRRGQVFVSDLERLVAKIEEEIELKQ